MEQNRDHTYKTTHVVVCVSAVHAGGRGLCVPGEYTAAAALLQVHGHGVPRIQQPRGLW